MSVFDHWHPILVSERLTASPVSVRLHGKELVLFRPEPDRIGALEDCCPHRRMRLSTGKVIGGRLQCPYHGWTFNECGAGESPGTPKLYACARSFDAIDSRGAIWVKSQNSEAEFPAFDVTGCYHVCTLQHQVKAPLELVLDNFTEMEHSATTHNVFGYPLERMAEVKVRFEQTRTSVRVMNVGPPKKMPFILRLLLGIRRRFLFYDDWTTHFSPVHAVYDHWWADPSGRGQGLVRWRLYIFFTPVDQESTSIITFAFTKSRYPGPHGCIRLFKWLLRRMLHEEIVLDVKMLENLADKSPSIEGMKLSRFDPVLGWQRDRIDRIYRKT
jgi:phenylpropionate dioxygenase-like ring-hydroxylating dioxygenase large terminal subunit